MLEACESYDTQNNTWKSMKPVPRQTDVFYTVMVFNDRFVYALDYSTDISIKMQVLDTDKSGQSIVQEPMCDRQKLIIEAEWSEITIQNPHHRKFYSSLQLNDSELLIFCNNDIGGVDALTFNAAEAQQDSQR